MSRMITAASDAVAVERVGTACTLPDSRATWFWIISKQAAVRRQLVATTCLTPSLKTCLPDMPVLLSSVADTNSPLRCCFHSQTSIAKYRPCTNWHCFHSCYRDLQYLPSHVGRLSTYDSPNGEVLWGWCAIHWHP